MVVFAKGKPRYAAIAQELASAIDDGTYGVGEWLPSQAELCARYGVSNYTVRDAMRVLQDMRLVVPEQGRGTRVTGRSARPRYVHTLDSIPDVGELARETSIRVLRRERIAAEQAECALPPHTADWFLIEAVRRLETPLVWKHIYLDARYTLAADEAGKTSSPIYELVQRLYGVTLVTVRQEVGAAAIAPAVASLLEVEPGSPALVIERHYVGDTGAIFEVTKSIYPADRFRYSTELHLEMVSGVGGDLR